MKNTIWKRMSLHSHIIVFYTFWSYFIGYVIAKSLLGLPKVFDYVFCALGGVLVGYNIALWSVKTLRKE